MTNKGFQTNENIAVRKKGNIVADEKTLLEIFNSHYIHIVQKRSGMPPSIMGNLNNPKKVSKTVKMIIEKYKNHPSIVVIESFISLKQRFYIPNANVEQINKIIKKINSNTATRPDEIPQKLSSCL